MTAAYYNQPTLDMLYHFKGVTSLLLAFVVLATIHLTCRYKFRKIMAMDKLAFFFQHWFHVCLYLSVLVISNGYLLNEFTKYGVGLARDSFTEALVELSPMLSDYFIMATAFFWCCFRLRKGWLVSHGLTLTHQPIKKDEECSTPN